MGAIRELIIVQDGVTRRCPLEAAATVSQEYGTLQQADTSRNMAGTARRRGLWCKRTTTLSGTGWLPDSWEGIDWLRPVEIHCVAPLALEAPSSSIALPTARRQDVTPWGFAIVDGRVRQTPLVMAGDAALLTPVAGADRYRAQYLPILTCYADPPSRVLDRNASDWRWTIEAEEV